MFVLLAELLHVKGWENPRVRIEERQMSDRGDEAKQIGHRHHIRRPMLKGEMGTMIHKGRRGEAVVLKSIAIYLEQDDVTGFTIEPFNRPVPAAPGRMNIEIPQTGPVDSQAFDSMTCIQERAVVFRVEECVDEKVPDAFESVEMRLRLDGY